MPFRIALSGLHSSSTDLKVTGNNIANSSTTGFKRSRAEFVDVYASAYGAITSVTNGSGVRTPNIRQMFAQGNIEYTDNSTDLAITGQGFFVVEDTKGRYLTRNGTFGLDRDGNVVNSTGQTLQVFPPVTVGNQTTFNTGSLVDVQLNNTIGAPVATTRADINVNLDANILPTSFFNTNASAMPPPAVPVPPAAAGGVGNVYDHTTGPIAFNRADPTTFHHVTATTVYDSLGGDHVAQMYFRKVDNDSLATPPAVNNLWQVISYIDGVELPPSSTGVAGGPPPANGQGVVLEFNSDGTMANAMYDGIAAAALPNTEIAFSSFTPNTGANPIDISIDFARTTQYGDDFAVNLLSQDGFTTGRLTGFDVEENGTVFARYTNGNAEVLGMVALANVANPEGLRQRGDSLWVETFDAGDTVLGEPGTASLGLIQSGALESSTVEIADELVNMIVSQRNYQANAQVITTADQLTQTLLNIR